MSKKIHVRPGKTQSKAGFIAGIIFCLIGVVVVIPVFGPIGILWTAAAGWITYSHYRNGFTDKPIATQVIEVEGEGEDITVTKHTGLGAYSYAAGTANAENATAESTTANHASTEENSIVRDSVEERLRKLQSLYDQMLITREEYEAKKKDILEEL